MRLEGLAWALVHSTWQGALVAGIGGLALRALHRSSAELRYRVLGALLALQVAWFLWTAHALSSSAAPLALEAVAVVPGRQWWPTALVIGWSAGAAVLMLRLVAGLLQVQRWRSRSIAAPPEWQYRVDELRWLLRIERRVRLRLVQDGVPMAIGVFDPVVLLPASLLVQLSPAQLEAILIHELAHVRRLDFVFNLAQALAEMLLFHHPATWWLSGRIRHERELCCDELAARATDPLLVARALTELEALRAPAIVPAARSRT